MNSDELENYYNPNYMESIGTNQILHEDNHNLENYNNMEKHIRYLWNVVIVPYLENYNERQILDYITINDYSVFRDFMIKENPICQQIMAEYFNME